MDSKRLKLLNISRKFASDLEDLLKESPSASSQSASPSSLIKRGRELQKKKLKLSHDDDKLIQVSLCRMKVGRSGSYVRDGKSIELFAARSTSHQGLIQLGSVNLHLKPYNKGQHLALFTLSGAVILPSTEWTLEEYLRRIHKSDVKLGLGYIDSENSSSSSSSSSSGRLTSSGKSSLGTHGRSKGYISDPSIGASKYSKVQGISDNVDDNSPVTVSSDGDSDTHYNIPPKFKVVPADIGVKEKDSGTRASRNPPPSICSGNCMEFDSKELAQSTNNYRRSSLIGKGGYGSVYKGRLRGCMDVAVKVLSTEGHQALLRSHPTQQMQSEISALTKFRHPNILSLCGYCIKPPIIVYELMPNGSLYSHLHEESKNLSWAQRVAILEGTCKGLVYLHSGDPPMVHQDIKSENILLDSAMNPKLADFGFAMELPSLSHGVTVFSAGFIGRSDGYYASEITHGNISDRSDVYSYGIVVLETFTAQLVYDAKRPDKKLADHLEDKLVSCESFETVFDPKLPPEDIQKGKTFVYKIIKATLKTHSRRPSAVQVLDMWRDMEEIIASQ